MYRICADAADLQDKTEFYYAAFPDMYYFCTAVFNRYRVLSVDTLCILCGYQIFVRNLSDTPYVSVRYLLSGGQPAGNNADGCQLESGLSADTVCKRMCYVRAFPRTLGLDKTCHMVRGKPVVRNDSFQIQREQDNADYLVCNRISD